MCSRAILGVGILAAASLGWTGCREFSPIRKSASFGGTASIAGSVGIGGSQTSDVSGQASAGDGGSGDARAGEAGSDGGGIDAGGASGGTLGGGGSSGSVGSGGGGRDLGGADQGTGGEPVDPPYCVTTKAGHPVIPLSTASDIASGNTANDVPFVLFVTQPATNVVALTWSTGGSGANVSWAATWGCFDQVLDPKRVAAGNGDDHNLQVYALSEDGKLFARQQAYLTYDPWGGMALPAGTTSATDVAVDALSLYLSSPQGVFRRARAHDEQAVTDPAWIQLLDLPSERVAAGVGEGGRTIVATLDATGRLQVSLETEVASNKFLQPELWDYPERLTDVAFGLDAAGATELFATTSEGALEVRKLTDAKWSEWLEVASPTIARHLTSFTVHSLRDNEPFLFGIGDYNLPYMSSNGGATWSRRF